MINNYKEHKVQENGINSDFLIDQFDSVSYYNLTFIHLILIKPNSIPFGSRQINTVSINTEYLPFDFIRIRTYSLIRRNNHISLLAFKTNILSVI